MDALRITGGVPLRGVVKISGAKNAALPLMTAALLTDKPITFTNVPHLADVSTMAALLGLLGVRASLDGNARGGHVGEVLTLDASAVNSTTAPYDIVRKMRASVLVLGPLLARFGEARVSLPGGCAIGTRPVDLHLKALEELGAEITLEDGYIHAKSSGRLKGADITFGIVSVGATENLLMAASLADGTTILRNAAREPEVADLARCLVKMGAKIDGIGSDTLTIEGQKTLHGCEHDIIPDRIETGTYAVAAAITGGRVEIRNTQPALLGAALTAMRDAGVSIETTEDSLIVSCDRSALTGIDITTAPHPAFPTDMQAQMMALLTFANGASVISETIFENRFMHVPELTRMGADIAIHGNVATIRGVEGLHGAPVMATDLRASGSLVLAALAAEGTSVIHRVYHLDRGYERFDEKLRLLGAKVERVKE